MALFSKKKKGEKGQQNVGRMEDYYVIFSLNKSASREENLSILRKQFGELTQNMGGGALNGSDIQERLRMMRDKLAEAIKVFKNKESYEQYNADLQVAYANNQVDMAAQKASADFLDEIQKLYMAGKYALVIQRCVSELDRGVVDINVYVWLARSYWMVDKDQQALDTVDKGLKVDSKNIDLMRVGSRIYTDDMKDYDAAQNMINKMIAVNESLGTAEQVNLFTAFGKEDVAYKTIDDYVAAHPYDEAFKENCANDLIGRAYKCYETVQLADGSKSLFLLSEEAYNKCLSFTEKAAAVYPCQETAQELKDAQSFGEVVFNEDNKENIRWCTLAALAYSFGFAFYVVGFFASIGQLFKEFSEIGFFGFLGGLFSALVILAIFGLLAYVTWKVTLGLKKVSRRPYWQIYRYEITGERLPEEAKYIKYGNWLSGYMKWSWKCSKALMKFAFSLAGM